ncbi:hypothetical protein WAI453_005774 [Rhynchosporium graminicola]
MKYILQLSMSASTAFAAALHDGVEVIRAFDIALYGGPILDLQITDPRFPGQVFRGPGDEIYKKIIGLKLELFVDGVLIASNPVPRSSAQAPTSQSVCVSQIGFGGHRRRVL